MTISVFVLGREDFLKKALITIILGKELRGNSQSTNKIQEHTEIFENDTFKIVCAPDLRSGENDIRNIFSLKQPDLSLLVVNNDFSNDKVCEDIEKLSQITGRPKDIFTVLLPFSFKPADSYPFQFCTMESLFDKLGKLVEDKHQIPVNKRTCHHPESAAHTKGNSTGATVNLVLLGLSGSGKSASGNTILTRKEFVSKTTAHSVTTECQVAETEINGVHVRVIDTPEIFDEMNASVRDRHVTMCRQMCQSGICVYLLVTQVGRFTDGERGILQKLEKTFGSTARDKTVLLFTCGEDLQHANMNLKDFLRSCPSELNQIAEMCGQRCVVFANKSPDSHQVQELMEIVERMCKKQNH